MSIPELGLILEQSRKLNKCRGITGMLIYIEGQFARIKSRTISSSVSGMFMQILEGSKDEVEHIFNIICSDTRHHDILVLQKTDVPSGNFESWSMGFKSFALNDYYNVPGYFSLDDSFLASAELQSSNLPLQFLKSFYQRGMQESSVFDSV